MPKPAAQTLNTVIPSTTYFNNHARGFEDLSLNTYYSHERPGIIQRREKGL